MTNPVGSLMGMFVASIMILNKLEIEQFRAEEKLQHPEYAHCSLVAADEKLTEALYTFSKEEPFNHMAMQAVDLATIRDPYVVIAMIVIVLFFIYLFYHLPNTQAGKVNQSDNSAKE